MVRVSLVALMALLWSTSAQAALVKYNFDTDLAPTTVNGVMSATNLTPISGRVAYAAGQGVGGTGAAQYTVSTTAQPGAQAATLTLSSANFFTVNSLSLDYKTSGRALLNVFNSVDGQVAGFVTTGPTSYTNFGYTFGPGLAAVNNGGVYEITFTFFRGSNGGGAVQIAMDNLEIDGSVVPEPASMAVFGVLGLAGVCYRRRLAKRANV